MSAVAQEAGARARAPRPPLGRDFGRLWTAAAFSNLADGLGRTAVPLIATTLTRDPLAIATLGALAFVPWLVFGLPAGMIVDRFDRRWIMAGANLLRGGTAVVLATMTVTGTLTIWTLFAGALVFGLGETLFDNATNAVVPALVGRRSLDRANGFMQTAQVTVDGFVAQPIAGVLFAVSMALPMWAGAAGYAIPVVLAIFLPLTAARPLRRPLPGAATAPAAPTRAPGAAREAASYLWHHHYLRAMVVFTSVLGCAFSFAQAPTVLYFLDEMQVQPAAIGVVTAGIGLGALTGSLVAPGLVARFGRGPVMVGATTASGVFLLGVALAPEVVTAVLAYAGMACSVSVWNVPWGALRQSIVPNEIFGRVLGIIRSLTWGLFPFATVLGGLLARHDLRLPYLVASVVTLVATAVSVRLLLKASSTEAVDDDEPEPPAPGPAAPASTTSGQRT